MHAAGVRQVTVMSQFAGTCSTMSVGPASVAAAGSQTIRYLEMNGQSHESCSAHRYCLLAKQRRQGGGMGGRGGEREEGSKARGREGEGGSCRTDMVPRVSQPEPATPPPM